jgi:hypothetical protein
MHSLHTAEVHKENYFKLAFSATLHCLIGCGLGEVLGMILGTLFLLSNHATMILAIILGFIGGFGLGVIPFRKAGYTWKAALKQVLIAEGLSIAVMETFEVLVQVYTPGVMEAGLTDSIFWIGMLLGLIAGFIAAFPVNYIFVKKGIRHHH